MNAAAQTSNLVIFSEAGETFTLYVNGVRKNATPDSNAKAIGMTEDGCKVRVDFLDSSIPDLNKFISLSTGEETTFGIVKNKKGVYVLRHTSTVAIPDESTTPHETKVIVVQGDSEPVSQTTTVSTTTSEKMASSAEGSDLNGVSMNVNAGDANVNFSVSVNGASANVNGSATQSTNTSYTTTTTTTSTSTPATVNTKTANTSCALSETDFRNGIDAVRSKSFAETKMSTAKQALKNKCVTTEQVKGFASEFTFENDKLDFLKYAYEFTSDKNNFYLLSSVFEHESTMEDLNEYIDSKK
jgi:hypothetical protein